MLVSKSNGNVGAFIAPYLLQIYKSPDPTGEPGYDVDHKQVFTIQLTSDHITK
jgi:hypothetical protein